MNSKFFSPELVADMLSTSKSTIHSWIRKKKINYITKQNKLLIAREELRRFAKLNFLFEKNKEKKPKPKKNILLLNFLQVVVDLLWVWSKLVLVV